MSILSCEIGSGFGEPAGTPHHEFPGIPLRGYDIKLLLLSPGLIPLPPQGVLGGDGGGAKKLLKSSLLWWRAVYWLKPFSVTI